MLAPPAWTGGKPRLCGEEDDQAMSDHVPWTTCRPALKVLGCTIRSVLVNDSQFDHDVVKAVYEAVVESGIGHVEIGGAHDRTRLLRPLPAGFFR